MGLLQRALETYENNENLVGKMEPNKAPLIPIGHSTVAASVEITIDAEGNYLNANLLDKAEEIIIPITDASADRSGKAKDDNIHPHMLCDNLNYLALNPDLRSVYLRQLNEWKNSDFSHPLISAVYKYIESNKIIANLNSMLELNTSNKLKKKKEIGKKIVRWIVIFDGKPVRCWESKELIDNYSSYYLSKIDFNKNLCMITGKITKIMPNKRHSKGIIPSKYTAKLISAKDEDNSKYHGRFFNDTEAFTASSIAVLKAYNALKWLVKNQGVKYGNVTYIFWKPEGIKLKANPFDALLGPEPKIRPSDYKRDLYKTLMSYKKAGNNLSNVVIACFGAATTGRLSINYYSEFSEPDYYKRLESWDKSCCWWFFNGENKEFEILSPDLKSIAMYAFGTYRKDLKGKEKFKLEDKVLGKRIQELLHCRIDKAKLPYIYVKALLNKAGNLSLYKDDIDSKRKVLFITCAVIQKYYIDNNKGEFDMERVESERNDVSYQYGRLLAILEKIERDTYSGDDNKRIPNVIRLQSKFIQQPLTIFEKIYEKLNIAYIPKLSLGSQVYYKKLLADVVADLNKCERYEELMDKSLKPTYIIGYFVQNKELYSKKDNEQELEEK